MQRNVDNRRIKVKIKLIIKKKSKKTILKINKYIHTLNIEAFLDKSIFNNLRLNVDCVFLCFIVIFKKYYIIFMFYIIK